MSATVVHCRMKDTQMSVGYVVHDTCPLGCVHDTIESLHPEVPRMAEIIFWPDEFLPALHYSRFVTRLICMQMRRRELMLYAMPLLCSFSTSCLSSQRSRTSSLVGAYGSRNTWIMISNPEIECCCLGNVAFSLSLAPPSFNVTR